jgi:phosphoribosylformimino-5-aminoimidazole carboxamide ribonucleotide (ProFAR) isomerase
MRIIPAIDIIGGKCVRLTKGDYSTKKIYNENPLEVAKEFEAHGIRYLHLVDLDGAKSSTTLFCTPLPHRPRCKSILAAVSSPMKPCA